MTTRTIKNTKECRKWTPMKYYNDNIIQGFSVSAKHEYCNTLLTLYMLTPGRSDSLEPSPRSVGQ